MFNISYFKVSGNIKEPTVRNYDGSGVKAKIELDGQIIPNLSLSNTMYDAVESDQNVTIYGFMRNSKNKTKNQGFVYRIKKDNGETLTWSKLRFLVPLMLVGFAVLAFCLVFVLGWAASIIPVAMMIGNDDTDAVLYYTTVFATIEAVLAALFFVGCGAALFLKTADPESWPAVKPSELSSRFSKVHK